jgi:nicotinic acid mononucleotide adenylyltransferase
MLIANEPHADFTLALGTDTFLDLASGKWRRTNEVFQLVEHRMVVFRRFSENNDNGSEREELIRQCIAKRRLGNDTHPSIRLVTIPSLTDVSSSTVRSTIDETILSTMITEPILNYIKQNKLYAFADAED